ncbi:polycystin-1-like protein 2, partial [Cylas formicarius]|uniref:polycystin-1-like protein 2 n=1 Tax=Cylas formicarius TaxID=197179 RepID=UPI002958B940
FVCYCVVLGFALLERPKDFYDKIYFLADVPRCYEFNYLIIVETGNKRNAGTTSNVTIKLHGSETDSLQHVLNYPDPEKRILQSNNEDLFVVSTEHPLGELEEIELWIDSIGNNPSWYCSGVRIYDFQSKNIWSFDVKHWFNASSAFYVSKVSKSATEDQVKIKKKKSHFFRDTKRYHTWSIKNSDEVMTKKERGTIILSIVVTVFGTEMLFYNCPRFDNSDGIDFNDLGFNFNLEKTVTDQVSKMLLHIEVQKAAVYKSFGELALRPHFEHLYYPLDEKTKKERKSWQEAKAKILEILEDLIMIVVYVSLLYAVILLDRDKFSIYSHEEMHNLVSGSHVVTKMKFDNVRSLNHIVQYIEQTFIPSLQAREWYDGYVKDYPGLTKDFANKYMGVARIRQHRTKYEACALPTQMKFFNITCRSRFAAAEEYRSFMDRWNRQTLALGKINQRMRIAWIYTNATMTGTFAYAGKFAVYPGGGYITPLGRTIKNSYINMQYLKRKNWLDLLTRAVFLEFLTYNPNCNVFNSIRVVFEISATGLVEKKLEIQTRKLLFLKSEVVAMRKVVYIAFIAILLTYAIKTTYRIFKKWKIALKDIWCIIDIVIVSCSFGTIYLYTARMTQIDAYLSELAETANNKFVNYFHLFTAYNMLTSFAGFLIFIATFRLWKLLRFLVIIKIVEKTLKDSAVPVLVLFIYQLIYTVGFSMAGSLLFGEMLVDFRSFVNSFTTLMLLGVGLYGIDIKVVSEHPIGPIYYVLYMLCSLFTVTTYIAIVTIYYSEANEFYCNERGLVQTYLKQKWTYYSTLLKIRLKNLRGGQENKTRNYLVPPKPDAYRYSKCLSIPKNRLNIMALVSKCVLRNRERNGDLTESDLELMRRIIDRLMREVRLKEQPYIVPKKKKSIYEERVERLQMLVKNVETMLDILGNVNFDS